MHYNKEYEIILKFIKITRMNIIIGMGEWDADIILVQK